MGGMALFAISLALFIFLDVDLTLDPMIPSLLIGTAVLGILIVVRAPIRPVRRLLLNLDMSRGSFHGTQRKTNGSGDSYVEWAVAEVDELLFAMRDVPVRQSARSNVSIHGFALYVRMMDEEDLVPVIEACLDHDRTYKVARFLSEAFGVGIKQVGKGWKG